MPSGDPDRLKRCEEFANRRRQLACTDVPYLNTKKTQNTRTALAELWANIGCLWLYPSNTRRWANSGLMLVQRLRRWPNIKPPLAQHLGFAGTCCCTDASCGIASHGVRFSPYHTTARPGRPASKPNWPSARNTCNLIKGGHHSVFRDGGGGGEVGLEFLLPRTNYLFQPGSAVRYFFKI